MTPTPTGDRVTTTLMVETKAAMNQPRILMSEVDAGGASAAPSAEPVVVPQAQGAAPAITKEVTDAIASAVTAALAAQKDSIYAEARRTFAKPSKTAANAESTAATPQPAQPDPIRLRSLDRALGKAGLATSLSDAQYQRAERAFGAETPDDVDGWVKDYFAGFGVAASPQPSQPVTATASPAPKPANEHPASDRGAPAASKIALEDQDFIRLSESDRAAFLKEKGPVEYRKALYASLKGRPIAKSR